MRLLSRSSQSIRLYSSNMVFLLITVTQSNVVNMDSENRSNSSGYMSELNMQFNQNATT